MLNVLWYITIVFSIWGYSLGGITIPGLGLLFPFRIAVIVLLALCIVIHHKQWKHLNIKSFPNTVFPFICFIILFSFLSILWTSDKLGTAKHIMNLLFVLMLCILFVFFGREEKVLKTTLLVLSGNMIVIMLIGVFESIGGIYFFSASSSIYEMVSNEFGMRFPAVCFDNTNNLAFNIVFMLPIMLYTIDHTLNTKKTPRLLLHIAVLALSAYILVQTCSRMGLASAYISVSAYYISAIRKTRILKTVLVSFLATVMIAGVVGGVYAYTRINSEENNPPDSLKVRYSLLKQAGHVLQESYYMGVGPGDLGMVMRQHDDPVLRRRNIYDLHELYVEIFATYGIAALLLLLYLQGKTFLCSLRTLKEPMSSPLRSLAGIAMASTLALLPASAMLSSSMYFNILWIQFGVWSVFLLHKKHQG